MAARVKRPGWPAASDRSCQWSTAPLRPDLAGTGIRGGPLDGLPFNTLGGSAMAVSMRPFFMFHTDGKAEEAMRFYTSLFTGATVDRADRYGPGEQGKEGALKRGETTILGQKLIFFDSPVPHTFNFTPAISLFVECESEAELRTLAKALGEGGSEYMPIGNYGFSALYAWIGDRYGVTWQLNLN